MSKKYKNHIFAGFTEFSLKCVTLELRLTDVQPLFSHQQLVLTNDKSEKCFLISTS